jgi:RsiW-degrading membrane proteinase PrsW (M82 family)
MNYLILVTAMLPVVILMYIIYKKDSLNPEPKEQLRKAFYWGVASCFLSFLLSGPFALIGLYSQEVKTLMDAFRISFFGAAIPEELAKFAVLWYFLRKNPHFDEKVDGIVYAACVSMGFAAFENIGYLFMNKDNFLSVGIGRAIFSVPGHLCFGIMMGYYYSLVKFYPNSKRHSTNRIMVLLVPILLHGLYDTMLFSFHALPPLLVLVMFATFLFFCVKMWKYAARRIEEHLARDMNSGSEEERNKSITEFRRLAKENPKVYESELGEVLAYMGDFYMEDERYEEAEAMYKEALEIYKRAELNSQHSYQVEKVKVLHNLGIVYFFGTGNYEKSRSVLKEAVQECYAMESSGLSDARLASVFDTMGQICLNAGYYDEARESFGHALDLYRKLSDKKSVASAMFAIGKAYSGMNRYGESRRWYDDTIEIYKELEVKQPDFLSNRLDTMNSKADSFLQEGCRVEYEEVQNEAYNCLVEYEHKHPGRYTEDMAMVKMRLGKFYYEAQNYELSRDALTKATSLFNSIENKTERAMKYNAEALALLAEMDGDTAPSLSELEQEE